MSSDGIEVVVRCERCGGGGLAVYSGDAATGCRTCDGTGHIRTTTLETPDEVVRLRERIEAHCERIAAASEVIARNAERSPLARLEASGLDYHISPCRVALCPKGGRVGIGKTVFVYAGHHDGPAPSPRILYLGTPDKPASLADCITAALDLWRELYGKDGGA